MQFLTILILFGLFIHLQLLNFFEFFLVTIYILILCFKIRKFNTRFPKIAFL